MMFGLENNVIAAINSVFEKIPEVEEVIIYGSRAKGNYRAGSDIDLTLIGKDLDYSILTKINIEIEELHLPYLFDISIFHKIKSTDLIEHINRVGEVFYERASLLI
ncbi:MAG: nucleotidyltransferase domain-containing protein [Candidatus Kapabacteria bacterium]|nr:nucleotidyltransferase domain-containing protein [Candidatus Kapabacteria bacterium]